MEYTQLTKNQRAGAVTFLLRNIEQIIGRGVRRENQKELMGFIYDNCEKKILSLPVDDLEELANKTGWVKNEE